MRPDHPWELRCFETSDGGYKVAQLEARIKGVDYGWRFETGGRMEVVEWLGKEFLKNAKHFDKYDLKFYEWPPDARIKRMLVDDPIWLANYLPSDA